MLAFARPRSLQNCLYANERSVLVRAGCAASRLINRRNPSWPMEKMKGINFEGAWVTQKNRRGVSRMTDASLYPRTNTKRRRVLKFSKVVFRISRSTRAAIFISAYSARRNDPADAIPTATNAISRVSTKWSSIRKSCTSLCSTILR